ncbi:GntR family transcriptional regulator [Rhizobium sp. BK068]|nr:GntR family transcriptional regulator [Rhizobium sp. BK068]
MGQLEVMTAMNGSPILTQMPKVGQSLDRRTARDLIADKLMVLIATNMLRPGDVLPGERELANVLHVSRETVRGAIQTLSARGIVEVSQGSRTRVCNVDLSHLTVTIASPNAIDSYDLDDVHAARLHIELKVVGDAADRIDEETLGKLKSLLEAQKLCGDDAMRFLICDREFHIGIYRACGNPLLCDFVTDLYTYMMDHRRSAMSRPGAIDASYDDHTEIVEALERRDRDAVVGAFRQHLTRIYDTTKELLGVTGQPKREKSKSRTKT